MNRETWLHTLTDRLRPLFKQTGYTLPDRIHVSCGWPSNRAIVPSGKNRTIGQCFSVACSADGRTELFISPALANGLKVAQTLVHELCHAALDCKGGHGPKFKRVALAMGLTGKMTATSAAPELEGRLNSLIGTMPPYPHAELDMAVDRKKEATRLIKIECICGYTARVSRKWLNKGLPTCPCGRKMAEVESQPLDTNARRRANTPTRLLAMLGSRRGRPPAIDPLIVVSKKKRAKLKK